ncbi:MAG: hypothetical protein ABIJ09_24495 [Pseudomonadota bacterium]
MIAQAQTRPARQLVLAVVLTCSGLLSACPADGTCQSARDCEGAQVCVNAACRDTCNSRLECHGFEACVDGVCVPAPDSGHTTDDASIADTVHTDRSSQDHAVPPDQGQQDVVRADLVVADVELDAGEEAGTDATMDATVTSDASSPDLGSSDGPGLDTMSGDLVMIDASTMDAGAPDAAPASVFSPILLPNGGSADWVSASPVNPERLYATLGGAHVVRSDNAGSRWTDCGAFPRWGFAAVASVTSADRVYLAMADDVLFSDDGCGSWNSLGVGEEPTALTVAPGDRVLVGTLSGLRVWATGTWSDLPSPHDGQWINAIAVDSSGDIVLVASEENGLIRSENRGRDWVVLSTGLTTTQLFDVQLDATDTDHILVACGDGVFVSWNGGTSFSRTKSGWFEAVAIDPLTPANVLVSGADGLYRSSDGGDSFGADCRSAGMNKAFVNHMLFVPGSDSRAYTATARGMFVASTGTCSWQEIDSGIQAWNIHEIAVAPGSGVLYLATGSAVLTEQNGWFVRSQGYSVYSYTPSLALDFGDPGVLYAGAAHQLLVSTNLASSFDYLTGPGSDWAYFSVQARGDQIYAGTDDQLVVSSNGGQSFSFRDIDGQKRRVSEIVVLDWQLPALLLGTGSGLFYTEDEGASFAELDLGISAPWVSSLAMRGDGSLVVGTEVGVFISAPNDLSRFAAWGLDGCDIADLAVAGDVVFAACGQAVYARDPMRDQWNERPGMQGIWVESLAVDGSTRLLVGTDGHGLFEMGL